MRHICASCPTSAASPSEVGPGESERTIGRPALSIALRIMWISSALYGCEEMQSTLRKSTPQVAYWVSSESYQAWPAALFLMPQLVGSQGQASDVSAASEAWKAEFAMGRLR